MRYLVLVVLLLVSANAAADTPRVVNRVLDLFDGEVLLDSESDVNLWESEVFSTDAFTHVGIRLSGEPGPMSTLFCAVAWQLAPGDAFRGSGPSASEGGIGPLDSKFFIQIPFDFGEVRGTRAKVACGPARSGHGGPSSGTLTDVKVLLRRTTAKVDTRVLDLFDGEILIDTDGEVSEWVSEPFDTSRFTRIQLGLDAAVEGANGIVCSGQWRSSGDEPWLDAFPAVAAGGFPLGPYCSTRPVDFGEIRGPEGRVACRPVSLGIGDDPGQTLDPSGLLRDVKVMLRRVSRPAPRVANRVLDLFDGELVLDSATGTSEWESEPFDTSRVTRIHPYLDADVEGPNGIACTTLWRLSHDDDWLDALPAVVAGEFPGAAPECGFRPPSFAEVRGREAKIACLAPSPREPESCAT